MNMQSQWARDRSATAFDKVADVYMRMGGSRRSAETSHLKIDRTIEQKA